MLHTESHHLISPTCCVESYITTVLCYTIANNKPLVSICLDLIWCSWLTLRNSQ